MEYLLQNIIKTLFQPIILFGTLFTLFYPSLMDVNKKGQPFYYAATIYYYGYYIFMTLQTVFKFIVKPELLKYRMNLLLKKT